MTKKDLVAVTFVGQSLDNVHTLFICWCVEKFTFKTETVKVDINTLFQNGFMISDICAAAHMTDGNLRWISTVSNQQLCLFRTHCTKLCMCDDDAACFFLGTSSSFEEDFFSWCDFIEAAGQFDDAGFDICAFDTFCKLSNHHFVDFFFNVGETSSEVPVCISTFCLEVIACRTDDVHACHIRDLLKETNITSAFVCCCIHDRVDAVCAGIINGFKTVSCIFFFFESAKCCITLEATETK